MYTPKEIKIKFMQTAMLLLLLLLSIFFAWVITIKYQAGELFVFADSPAAASSSTQVEPPVPPISAAETVSDTPGTSSGSVLSVITLPETAAPPGTPAVAPAPADPIILSMTAVGDCIVGDGYGFDRSTGIHAYIETKGEPYSYFFANVKEILDDSDISIANCEGVFTDSDTRIDKGSPKNGAYWFKGPPSYAQVFSDGGVDIVSLANNHSHDYGESGLDDTRRSLNEAGVGHFGYEDILYWHHPREDLVVSFLGLELIGYLNEDREHAQMRAWLDESVSEMRAGSDLQVVYFHWGAENVAEYTPGQEAVAEYAAEIGFDLILGAHPHRLQEVGQIGLVPVVYSLGNFVFGGRRSPGYDDTMIYRVEFELNPETKEVISVNSAEIPARISGNNSINNYQPVLNPAE